MATDITISTDKTKLDIRMIHTFLTRTYWAEGRSIEKVKETIKNTLCFGIYLKDKQIGFARVVTDKVIFAYLMDVFIVEEHRGKGYSKILLNAVFDHPDLIRVERWLLGTRDAHSLYEKYDFKKIEHPERLMGRKR